MSFLKKVGKLVKKVIKPVAKVATAFIDPVTSLSGLYGSSVQNISAANLATGAVGASAVTGFGGFTSGLQPNPAPAVDAGFSINDVFKTLTTAIVSDRKGKRIGDLNEKRREAESKKASNDNGINTSGLQRNKIPPMVIDVPLNQTEEKQPINMMFVIGIGAALLLFMTILVRR